MQALRLQSAGCLPGKARERFDAGDELPRLHQKRDKALAGRFRVRKPSP